MEIYKEVIIQAVIIFPVVAALFTMPYMLYNYHKYGSVLSYSGGNHISSCRSVIYDALYAIQLS